MTQVVAVSTQIFTHFATNMHLFQVIVDGSGILTHYLTGNSSIEQTQVKNTGSRGFDFYADSLLDGPSHLTVKNCTFQNYTGVSGIINGFVYIRISPSPYAIEIDIEHTTVIVALYNARHCITFIDSKFYENTGTPILLQVAPSLSLENSAL